MYQTKISASFHDHPLKKIKCLQNWWPVFKRTCKVFLNEKSFQQYLILAIFLCLLLELIGQPGQTLLKFKGPRGKSNGFVLLWILNVTIFSCYSIICSHMPLKMYRSFRLNPGSRLQESRYFLLLLKMLAPTLAAYLCVARRHPTFKRMYYEDSRILFLRGWWFLITSWKCIQLQSESTLTAHSDCCLSWHRRKRVLQFCHGCVWHWPCVRLSLFSHFWGLKSGLACARQVIHASQPIILFEDETFGKA